MPSERPFQHVQFSAQQIDLGAQVVLHRHTGDHGEMGQRFAAGLVADQKGLDALAQRLGRNGDADGPVAGAVGHGGHARAGPKRRSNRIGKGQVRKGINLSTVSSWRRRRSLDLPSVVFACCLLSPADADTGPVRIGESFHDLAAYPLSEFGTVAEVLKRLDLGAQVYAKGGGNCRELVDIPFGQEQTYDSWRDALFIVQSVKVECWAVLQFDPSLPVAQTGNRDEVTLEMVQDILAQAEPPSDENDKWKKIASEPSAKTFFWRDPDNLTLSSEGGWKSPDGNFEFHLLVADGDDRIVEVTHSVKGHRTRVYGVRWRKTATGGEVVDIFPDLD